MNNLNIQQEEPTRICSFTGILPYVVRFHSTKERFLEEKLSSAKLSKKFNEDNVQLLLSRLIFPDLEHFEIAYVWKTYRGFT